MAWLKHHGPRIEILGLVLVLGASCWKVFVQDPIHECANDGLHYRMEEKIDYLWLLAGQELKPGSPTDEFFSEQTPAWSFAEPGYPAFQRPLVLLTWVGAGLFSVGSCMLVVAKWAATKHKGRS